MGSGPVATFRLSELTSEYGPTFAVVQRLSTPKTVAEVFVRNWPEDDIARKKMNDCFGANLRRRFHFDQVPSKTAARKVSVDA